MSADNAGDNLSDLAESSNSNDVNETKNNAAAAADNTETTQEQETETVEKTPRNNQEKQYRINSPSYREVQNAVVEFEKFRSSLPGCSNWMSPEASGSSSAPLGKAIISNEVFTNKYDLPSWWLSYFCFVFNRVSI
jgi:hypothetical protein